jgi:predicted SAM-dependent methyltransferase
MDTVGIATDGLVTVLGALRATRRVRVAGIRPVKVNLGSGLHVVRGWLNLDASPHALAANLPTWAQRAAYRLSDTRSQRSVDDYLRVLRTHKFVFCDLRRGIPLPDACADFLYTSHFLEHLEPEGAVSLLREANRVLRPGAILRVVVPDFAYFVALYETGDRRRAVDGIFSACARGRLSRHRYMYDEPGLRELLREAGFPEVARCDAGRGETPDLDLLDTRVDESLFVEATRLGRGNHLGPEAEGVG